jgi:hypothetical protein
MYSGMNQNCTSECVVFQDSADQAVCIRTEELLKGIWDMFDLHESHSLEPKLILFAFEYVAMGILAPLRPHRAFRIPILRSFLPLQMAG